jgi:hypothetical protein
VMSNVAPKVDRMRSRMWARMWARMCVSQVASRGQAWVLWPAQLHSRHAQVTQAPESSANHADSPASTV